MERGNRSTGGKPLGAKERTKNKLNPHMASTPGFEPGPHWWETSALTTAPSLATNSLVIGIARAHFIKWLFLNCWEKNLAFYFAYSDVFVSFLHTVFCHPRLLFHKLSQKAKKKKLNYFKLSKTLNDRNCQRRIDK